jgi:hypothetical protein
LPRALERVTEAHCWARSQPDGTDRAFAWIGERGEVELDVGAPSSDERELAIVPEEGVHEHRVPSEEDVMSLAARWSVDPQTVEERV